MRDVLSVQKYDWSAEEICLTFIIYFVTIGFLWVNGFIWVMAFGGVWIFLCVELERR